MHLPRCPCLTWRILGLLLLCGLLLMLYGSTKGLPGRWLEPWLGSATGYRIALDRVRWDPLEGILGENVRIETDTQQFRAWLTAAQVIIRINPLAWISGQTWLRQVRMHNGALRLEWAGTSAGQERTSLAIHNIQGNLRYRQASWQLIELRAEMLDTAINCYGEMFFPPPQLATEDSSLQGWLACSGPVWQGVGMETGLVGFTFSDKLIQLEPLYVALTRGTSGGVLEGQACYHLETKDYTAQLKVQADPYCLTPLLNSNLVDWIRPWNGQRLEAELALGGRFDNEDALWITGRLAAGDGTYNTVPIKEFSTSISYAQDRLTLDNLYLARPEGALTGWLTTDLNETILEMDLSSTAHPVAIAKILGDDILAYLDGFHFEGQMRMSVRGRLDYETGTRTDLRAAIEGWEWGYLPWHAEHCAFNLALRQQDLHLTQLRGAAFEGTFSGEAAWHGSQADQASYTLQARLDDMNFNALLEGLGYTNQAEQAGHMYAECILAGALREGRLQASSGGGWIRIQDGLYQLHFLGDFARLLNTLAPRIGRISLTDFEATFSLNEQRLTTSAARLSGPQLAVHGQGHYALDDQLAFIVWVRLPERFLLLSSISQMTDALPFRLLAFRLTGPLANPQWWPLNLTQEQLRYLPTDLLVKMPKNILLDLPRNVLVTLPQEVLVTLPRELLVTLPREVLLKLPKRVLIDLPEELFIKLPQDIRSSLLPTPKRRSSERKKGQ